MTGIFPIKGYKKNSSIKGIFREYTMNSPNNIAKYVGFTDEEVKMLCEKYENLNDSNEEQITSNEGKLEKYKKFKNLNNSNKEQITTTKGKLEKK